MRLRFLTAGESHGKALVGILEGIPSGLSITSEYIHQQLKRRKLGYGRGARQKMEEDSVQILSGVRHGFTLGSPIALIIENADWKNWQDVMQVEPFHKETGEETGGERRRTRRKLEVPRPGHADYVGGIKYQHEDMRNVLERASARETTMRVALGSITRKFLEELEIHIGSRVIQIGPVSDPGSLEIPVRSLNERADQSPLRCLSSNIETEMCKEVDSAKKRGDTLGGIFEVYAAHTPIGLGSYVHWDRRIEGQISQAILSLNAIKGVEIGLGFESGKIYGSQAHDEYLPTHAKNRVSYRTNRSGGIDGGMTTGQTILVRAAMKPLSTLMNPLSSVKLSTGEVESAHVERSDVCAVPSAAVISESLLANVLADALLEKLGGDSMNEIIPRLKHWRQYSNAE